MQKFPLSDSRGFTMYDAKDLPCIVVNKSEDYAVARIFTLLHEYGHLLIRQPGISDENPANPVEAFCNRFAAGFLMPKFALRELMGTWPNGPIEWYSAQIQDWAKKLKVSQQALALRLEQLGLAPDGFHRRFIWSAPPPQAQKRKEGNYLNNRIFEIGGHFAGAVMGAFDRGAITKAAAVEALNLSPRHFERVRDTGSGRRGLIDARV